MEEKLSINNLRKLFREVFVVVIGVAITLFASYWLGIRNEERDMALYLNAIKMELEENIKILEAAIENLEPSLRYTDYLQSNDKELLNKDSLMSYQYTYYSFTGYSFKTNAFEMFKSSGIMRLVDDKELLLSLWDVYDEFTSVKETFDWFLPIKWEEIKKETALLLEGKEVKFPMYNFYYLDMPYQMMLPCGSALKKSKDVVSKLKEMKMLKPFETSEFKPTIETDVDFDKYLGVYSSEQTAVKISITKVNNKLFAQAVGQTSFPLEATGKDKFEYTKGDIIIEFNPTDSTAVLKQRRKVLNFKMEN